MKIQINGQVHSTRAPSIDALVDELNIEKMSLVIEHNGTIIKQGKWSETLLADGDVLELLNFVGGG